MTLAALMSLSSKTREEESTVSQRWAVGHAPKGDLSPKLSPTSSPPLVLTQPMPQSFGSRRMTHLSPAPTFSLNAATSLRRSPYVFSWPVRPSTTAIASGEDWAVERACSKNGIGGRIVMVMQKLELIFYRVVKCC